MTVIVRRRDTSYGDRGGGGLGMMATQMEVTAFFPNLHIHGYQADWHAIIIA